MWHGCGTRVHNFRMDENTRPPSKWEMWQQTPTKKKVPVIVLLVLGAWAFPPLIFFYVIYFGIQYSKRNK